MRLDMFAREAADTNGASELIQPSVENAAADDRFKTLFPLLLPTSLTDIGDLEVDIAFPSVKPMRAVYHANLLNPKTRLGSWSTRARILGMKVGGLDVRRQSAPDVRVRYLV